MKRLFKDHGLSLVLLAPFLAFRTARSIAGFHVFNDDQALRATGERDSMRFSPTCWAMRPANPVGCALPVVRSGDAAFLADNERSAGERGLGLYICREIVKVHHGPIDVSSPADGITEFTIELPKAGRRSSGAGRGANDGFHGPRFLS